MPFPGTMTACTPFRNWSSASTHVADAMTMRPVLLSTATIDQVAHAVEGRARRAREAKASGARRRIGKSYAHAALAPVLFQCLERTRPIIPEEPRERPVGEESPARLAGRAVVRLVRGVPDSLDGRAADRAGFAVPSVGGHARAKRGDLLRERITR